MNYTMIENLMLILSYFLFRTHYIIMSKMYTTKYNPRPGFYKEMYNYVFKSHG